MEAFSDGVIAIIITIMVLELRVPHEATVAALRPVAPVFANMWMAECCGRICICSSGSR